MSYISITLKKATEEKKKKLAISPKEELVRFGFSIRRQDLKTKEMR